VKFGQLLIRRLALLFFFVVPCPTRAQGRFLTLPFRDQSVQVQQAWHYTPGGTLHKPLGAIDFVKGVIDNSATWESFEVVAAADGVAIQSFEHGYGTMVLVRHNVVDAAGQNYFTLYAHLDPCSVDPSLPYVQRHTTNIQQWKPVNAGDFLARAGSSGYTECTAQSCIMLHFEVMRGGYYQNQTDPYDIRDVRNTYPGFPGFLACGPNYLWTTCPPRVFQGSSPHFAPTRPMNIERAGHTATLLRNGKVLVAGGFSAIPTILDTAELYDPASGVWRYTNGTMHFARSGHTATILQDGRVLIVGGSDSSTNLSTVEIYDPATETFHIVASLSEARRTHSAVALNDGRVMVVGGYNGSFGCFSCVSQAVEIFDMGLGLPGMGSWRIAAALPAGRTFLALSLLPNGNVLATGGQEPGQPGSTSVFMYEPSLDTWTTMSPLLHARQNHTSTTLPDGKVLFVGGVSTFSFTVTSSVEIYEVSHGFPNGQSVLGNSLIRARANHKATQLTNGDVFVGGGGDSAGFVLPAELFSATSRVWSAGGTLTAGRAAHSATLLPSGLILFAGGVSETSTGLTAVASAELWSP